MNNKSKWLWEFSKKVVRLMISAFIAQIAFTDAMILLTGDLSILGQVSDDLTEVVKICLGGYLFKAALENVFKIRSRYDEEY